MTEERWLRGTSSLLSTRAQRRRDAEARRRKSRKAIHAGDVRLEWEKENGTWMASLVGQELGFSNQTVEVDCHVYPPDSHSVSHRHNEAIIFVLRGRGYSLIDEERVEYGPGDTLYIPAGAWHQHFNPDPEEPIVALAIKPIPLQEYLGEVHIEYRYEPKINAEYEAPSFVELLQEK